MLQVNVQVRHVAMFRSTGGPPVPAERETPEHATHILDQIRLAQRERLIEQIPSQLFEDSPKKFCNE